MVYRLAAVVTRRGSPSCRFSASASSRSCSRSSCCRRCSGPWPAPPVGTPNRTRSSVHERLREVRAAASHRSLL